MNNKAMPKRLGVFLLAGLLLLPLLSGCGADDPRDSLVRDNTPHRGGVFRLALESVDNLDPAHTDDAYQATVTRQLYSTLVKWDVNLNVLPDVAESWTISRDGLDYVFELRDNARFHNGRQVTAEDFVYTFTRLLDPERAPPGIIQGYLGIIEGAEEFVAGRADTVAGIHAPDRFTLAIRLRKPYPSFLSVLCMDQSKVVPREEVERMGADEFGRHPVGSGPFRLVSWDPNEKLVLAANRDYYGVQAHLDTVIIHHYPADEGVREREEFFAGNLEAWELRETEPAEVSAQGGYPVVRRLELSTELLGMNVGLEPFDDVRVRRALAMAVDRDALASAAGSAFRTTAGLLPPGMPGYMPESKVLPEDLDRARALLAEAGYGPDRPLRFELFTTSRSRHAVRRDSVLVEALARIGVEVELRVSDWLEFIDAVGNGRAPSFALTWIADLPDPDSFLFTLLGSEGVYNLFNYRNPRLDALLAAGQYELNVPARLALYREAEKLALADAPLIPLFNSMTLYAFQPYVRGVEMSPMGISSVHMEKIWLERRTPEDLYAGY